MKPILLTDLDDTLFQTARKLPANLDHSDTKLAATKADGTPICFMTPWQTQFIDWALQSMHVVPITARSIEAFQRVQLPFQEWAICTHGAVILRADGTLDPEWHQQMQDELAEYQPRLQDYLATALQIGERLGFSLRGWLVRFRDHDPQSDAVYLVLKSNTNQSEHLRQIHEALQQRLDLSGLYVHRNDNNLALIPTMVSKQRAAEAVIKRYQAQYGRLPLLGFGDSLTDLGFMGLCDWAGIPTRSQIAKKLPF
ncbi:MAG: trehalose phosphatase [bacterium]